MSLLATLLATRPVTITYVEAAHNRLRKPVRMVPSQFIALQPYLEVKLMEKGAVVTAAELLSMRLALVIIAAPMDVAET